MRRRRREDRKMRVRLIRRRPVPVFSKRLDHRLLEIVLEAFHEGIHLSLDLVLTSGNMLVDEERHIIHVEITSRSNSMPLKPWGRPRLYREILLHPGLRGPRALRMRRHMTAET